MCEETWVDAEELLNSKRLDLIIEINYIRKYLELKKEMNSVGRRIEVMKKTYEYKCYKARVDAFTYGTYIEQNQSDTKNSMDIYVEVFHDIIDSMEVNGYLFTGDNYIPVGYDNVICDGSHRVACAIYFKKRIPVKYVPREGIFMDVPFMRKRYMDCGIINYAVAGYLMMNLKASAYAVYSKGGWNADKRVNTMRGKIVQTGAEIIYEKRLGCIIVFVFDGGRYMDIDEDLIVSCNKTEIAKLLQDFRENIFFSLARTIVRKIDRGIYIGEVWLTKKFPNIHKYYRKMVYKE